MKFCRKNLQFSYFSADKLVGTIIKLLLGEKIQVGSENWGYWVNIVWYTMLSMMFYWRYSCQYSEENIIQAVIKRNA